MLENLIMQSIQSGSRTLINPTRAITVWFTPKHWGWLCIWRELAYIFKIRLTLLRDIGAAVAPFNAWLLAQGLETLSLRIERHVDNALAVANWLEQHPQVEKVNYASLPSSPWNALAKKYCPRGSGSVLSFEIKGG